MYECKKLYNELHNQLNKKKYFTIYIGQAIETLNFVTS